MVEDIGPTLQAMGCYERRDGFIRELVPEYGPGWASKIVIANSLAGEGYNISSLVVQDPEGKRTKLRRELFNRQDEVEAQRNDLISQLEVQLQQHVAEQTLFTIEWELV